MKEYPYGFKPFDSHPLRTGQIHVASDEARTLCVRRPPTILIAENQMTDSSETKLIEALEKVEAYSDVVPAPLHDPRTMIIRQIAERQSACGIYRDFMRRTLATT